MKTSVGCLGIEPREVVIALADSNCDCRDIRSAQVSMKGGKPEINPLTPNDPYSGRTAPLTSKVAFYIFIQQI